jgi:hypothetical protein
LRATSCLFSGCDFIHAGFRAITHGLKFSADIMLATLDQTRYWREKLLNPDFHPSPFIRSVQQNR